MTKPSLTVLPGEGYIAAEEIAGELGNGRIVAVVGKNLFCWTSDIWFVLKLRKSLAHLDVQWLQITFADCRT